MGGRGGGGAWRRRAGAAALLALAALPATARGLRVHDPDALWKIVHGACVPNEQQHGNPAPCAVVDLRDGVADGYVVLKDIVGATQYLVMPTARITGIEDPLLLRSGAPNYFADAWRERSHTERAAGRPLPRDAISLAVNSRFARSQNQLHIHIDCVRPDVRAVLRRQQGRIGRNWALLPEPLAGRRWWAMRVIGATLDGADPFKLLAAGRPGARGATGRQGLVVVGADFADGPGFILLNNENNPATGDRGSGERLQDHSCMLAR
jgi:CDP-diacylglycerol pyrophosphatase